MALMEANALDMSTILLQAYELGDWINGSVEVAEYLQAKHEMEHDNSVKEIIRSFAKKKELFEECERFGHFHPDYNSAMEQVQKVQEQMEQNQVWSRFNQAEHQLDDLLYTVSKTIAHSVSMTIKVPSNVMQPDNGCSSGGCSTGGGCSGKCG
ncbi:YlbF family regulator [Paenibacillus psychroresistens]|uniref:YlbF family regulator n=1 Tax=Paenibacillus psychroresistens TaxID=1778678 RepID=A0A6B8RNK6_9BACL|nr:YlbF family regulator [Paenibacillus psychroresistens]QGQ96956.1 YlbF family regulator [Paenibacillus psychroresistens]